jgi:hypothetical protein
MQLSWDLHVHPGPSSVPRWGTGAQVQVAAARAGLRGFVWKSHETHTPLLCADLAPSPRAIGSASLNPWAGPDDVERAIVDGARWLWGPSRRPRLELGWDLPLPAWWPDLVDRLERLDGPLVLATGHLDATGRRAFAELASSSSRYLCSVTHAASLERPEVADLHRLGCLFEVDLYTAVHAVPGRPRPDLVSAVGALRAWGASVYLTTDAGQPETGDPYGFAEGILEPLVRALGIEEVEDMARTIPDHVAAHALSDVMGARSEALG